MQIISIELEMSLRAMIRACHSGPISDTVGLRMAFVAGEFEILIAEIEDSVHAGIQAHDFLLFDPLDARVFAYPVSKNVANFGMSGNG